jgi:hypothetical protein
LVVVVSALAVLYGTGVGIGVVLLVSGLVPSSGSSASVARVWRRALAWRRRVGIGGAAAVFVGALTRWPVAALGAALLGFALPTVLGARGASTRLISRTEAIASWTEMLRDTLVSVGGLEEAITATATVAPPPIRPEVIDLADRLRSTHVPLVDALRAFADSLSDPTADLVAAALLLAAERPPRTLPQTLRALANAARDDASMRLRVDAGRARTRTAVRVVMGVVVAFVAGLLLLSRSYLSPFDTAQGQALLAVVLSWFGVGLWWLSSLARPDVPARFLTSFESVRLETEAT